MLLFAHLERVRSADNVPRFQSGRAADPEVGHRPVQHQRHPGTLAAGAEPVGLPGGRLRRRRHRQAAAQRGAPLRQNRQGPF